MAPDRIYRQFCMTARALEVVGERWSLLVVRDLLPGPRRFTDLDRSLSPITPTRLTSRLRRLEAAGVMTRSSAPRGREVWYELTTAGLALEPVIDQLTFWGIEHARDRPRLGEPVRCEAAMTGTKVWLNHYSPALPDGLVWLWGFPGEDSYTLTKRDGAWRLTRGQARKAAVTVNATHEDWAAFLTSPRKGRKLPTNDVALEGRRSEIKRFVKAFAATLAGG